MSITVKTWRLKRYCKEYLKIENYDKAIEDKDICWHVHHREEDNGLSCNELKKLGRYWNLLPEDLIFLPPDEHNKLPAVFSKEVKNEMIKRCTGDKNPMFNNISKEIILQYVNTGLSLKNMSKKIYEETGIKIGRHCLSRKIKEFFPDFNIDFSQKRENNPAYNSLVSIEMIEKYLEENLSEREIVRRLKQDYNITVSRGIVSSRKRWIYENKLKNK